MTIELSGKRFGRLSVLHRSDPNLCKMWYCVCDCGNSHVASGYDMLRGSVASCGCLRAEVQVTHGRKNRRHGMRKSPEYHVWCSMKMRCSDVSNRNYGARGIRVCDEWVNSFSAFIDHVGVRPFAGAEIDRADPNGNYEPGNVRWATKRQNCLNRRNTRYVVLNGDTVCLRDACIWAGVNYSTVLSPVYHGKLELQESFDKQLHRKVTSDQARNV